MNKEEIEKAKECLNEVIQNTYAEGKAIKLDYLRKYIESLELTNETWQVVYELLNREIKELEQKETILNKVTDKLKDDIRKAKEQIKFWEQRYKIAKEEQEEFYIKSYHRQINRWQSRYETLKEILNIIEGEKK